MNSRRYFIGMGLSAASAVVLLRGTWRLGSRDLAVFDPRFEGAEDLARQIAEGGSVRAIGADATDLALWLQSRALVGEPVHLQGVTTGSVPFCLRQLVPHVSCMTRRLDRDLFVWSARLPAAKA